MIGKERGNFGANGCSLEGGEARRGESVSVQLCHSAESRRTHARHAIERRAAPVDCSGEPLLTSFDDDRRL